MPSSIRHNLIFNPVMIVEIETTSGIVSLVTMGLDAVFADPFFRRSKVLNKNTEMIDSTRQPSSARPSFR